MSSKEKKEHWYVLVMSNDGPVFVTGEERHNYAVWNKKAKPLEFSKNYAKEMATGLMINFQQAYPICAPIELTHQPYLYDRGKFEWVWNDKKKEETT